MKPWIFLVLAGLLEIGWALGLKASQGFTRLWPSVWTIAGMIVSFALLSQSAKSLPIGTAYAVWTGIGAAGTAAIGMAFLGEERSLARVACLLLIIGGTLGLKLLGR